MIGKKGRGHNPGARLALRRAAGLGIVLGALLIASFLIVRLIPGDPARAIAGFDASQEEVERVRTALGLDRPVLIQFVAYTRNALRLDFGESFVTSEPVTKVIADRLPKTGQLALVSLLLVLALSVPLGMIAGALTREGRNRGAEVAFTAVTSVGGALPEFLASTFLAFIFAVWLRWLPVAGADVSTAFILPALAISIRPIAILSRIVRVETLNVLAQDYIRTARSKRLPARLLYLRHTLPNVLTAALTIGGLLFAGLLGGAVIVENVFAWPGLGTAVVSAVLARDYPVIQGVILMLGIAVVLVNTLVDILLGMVDPRSIIRTA
ncbi:MAG: ABC transporter permease [Armatimonadota bacterium]